MLQTRGNAPKYTRSSGAGIQTETGSLAAEPDALRDAVCKALSSITIDQRSEFRAKLLAGLRNAGLKVRSCLLMLGVSAGTAADLTAPEIASLIRYVRLTEPKALSAVTELLIELLSSSESTGTRDVAA